MRPKASRHVNNSAGSPLLVLLGAYLVRIVFFFFFFFWGGGGEVDIEGTKGRKDEMVVFVEAPVLLDSLPAEKSALSSDQDRSFHGHILKNIYMYINK